MREVARRNQTQVKNPGQSQARGKSLDRTRKPRELKGRGKDIKPENQKT